MDAVDLTQLTGLPAWAAVMIMAWRIAQLYLQEREKDRAFQRAEQEADRTFQRDERAAERAERVTDRSAFREDVRHVLETSTSKYCLDSARLDALQKELQRIHDLLILLTKDRIGEDE